MKRKHGWWIGLVLLLAVAGVLIWHFTRSAPIEVVVKRVEKGTVERTVANTRAGTVEPTRRAKLSLSVGGQIAKLPVQEGDVVKAGQLLVELWNEDLRAQVELAQHEADAAKAHAEAECLNADVAEREARRLVRLRETGATSEERTDRAVTEAKALRASCHAARANTLRSKAQLDVAKATLARTQLIAPFDGVIAEINGELNEYLTPSPPGIATPPAVDLIDHSSFYVTAPIDEVDASQIAPGMPARISLDAFGDRRFDGKVRRIAPYVLDREKQARTVDVEVDFTEPGNTEQLLAGYSADVEIILDAHHDTLRIPSEAVLEGKRVFVYLPGKKIIEERIFEKGISNWNFTEVSSGLKPDEFVVINADRAGVKDGARAVVVEEES
jgi:HlyD family secretion protein